jgi:hypothetical protein
LVKLVATYIKISDKSLMEQMEKQVGLRKLVKIGKFVVEVDLQE